MSAATRLTKPAAGLLIATLIAALLGAAAAALLASGRAARGEFTESLRTERARLLADAAIARATVALDSEQRLDLDGRPAILPDADGQGETLYLQDTAGLVDINRASVDQLTALLTGLDVPPGRAGAIAGAVVAERQDAPVTSHGTIETTAVGQTTVAPRKPFETEADLLQVAGVSPALFACLAAFVTVDSGMAEIDGSKAPARLKAIQGLKSLPGSTDTRGAPIGHVIIISARAPLSKGAAVEVVRWVRMTGNPRQPVMVHRAQSRLVPLAAPPDASCAGLDGSKAP